MVRKCEVCGKEMIDSLGTHCSEQCLFKSIKDSQPFMVSDEQKDNHHS